jgi:hypothetical protein
MSYTVEQVAALTNAAPVSYERALELAMELGKTPRSVIAKVKSLGLAYEPKPAAPKRPKGLTKTELVGYIAARLDVPAEALEGLTKATSQSLDKLFSAIS